MVPSIPRGAPPGREAWAFALPAIPTASHGPEPAFTSRDTLCILNAGATLANVRLQVRYADRSACAAYRITVAAHRLRRIRINDLIFPEAVLLEQPYGIELTADRPVIVQLTGQRTCARTHAWTGTPAWPDAHG